MLHKKMFRDMLENKLAYLSCILIITIGLMTSVSMGMVSEGMMDSKESFYKDYKFADGFITLAPGTKSILDKVKDVEGIKRAQGRLIHDVRVNLKDNHDYITLRLISYDPIEQHLLNAPYLIEGSELVGEKESMWLGLKFFQAHQLQLGDTIPLIVKGNQMDFTIKSIIQTPEYVFPVQSETVLMQTAENFDIAFVPYATMEKLFAMEGQINDISFTLEEGYVFDDVKDELQRTLTPYGLMKLYGRKDQISNLLLEEELEGLTTMSTTMPIAFLSISTIILYIMLKRLTEQQRQQMGTLKAFGYRRNEIMLHYMSYALIIGIIGGMVGGLAGLAFAYPMMEMYQFFFNLPNLTITFSLKYFIYSFVLSVMFSLIAGYAGCRKILKLNPSEAMHQPVPKYSGQIWIEKIKWLWNGLTVQGRMAVRNIFRNKGRSMFTIVGIIFSFSIMATMFCFVDMMDLMFINQYTKIEKYDMKIDLAKPVSTKEVIQEIYQYEGVTKAESLTVIPCTINNLHLKKDTVMYGLDNNATLYQVLDVDENQVDIPAVGVLLPQRMADSLQVGKGDRVHLKSPYFFEEEIIIPVAGIVPQYLGSNIYINKEDLFSRIGGEPFTTSLMLKVEDGYIDPLKEQLYESDNIIFVEEKKEILNNFEELVKPFMSMIWVFAAVAILTAFAILYTSSIIGFSERERELASMRVLGMHIKEVLEVMTFEQWLLGILGSVLGIPVTYWMVDYLSKTYQNDIFTIPAKVESYIFIYAFVGTAVAIWLVQLYLSKKIRVLNFVEVLKERE